MDKDAEFATVGELIAYLESVRAAYGDIGVCRREADEAGWTVTDLDVRLEPGNPPVLLF